MIMFPTRFQCLPKKEYAEAKQEGRGHLVRICYYWFLPSLIEDLYLENLWLPQ